jgi:hypothetical protein
MPIDTKTAENVMASKDRLNRNVSPGNSIVVPPYGLVSPANADTLKGQ